MKIDAIIFDFGGIFLDIDYKKTSRAFKNLGMVHFDEYYQQSFTNPLFADFETGKIDDKEWLDGLRQESGCNLTDTQMIDAWNAMLGKFRPSSISYLRSLKNKVPVFLLSNTNVIHHHAFHNIHEEQFGNRDFDSGFDKAYYSHVIQIKKPDAGAYKIILQENGLLAATTLFVDDTEKNIVGAEAVGLQTLFLKNNKLVEEAMREMECF
jgi:FMN phosphatase YigB (HAD superfamily)